MKYDFVYVGINGHQQSMFSIYPNPVKERMTIETSVASQESQLSILNLNSQEVLTRQITEPKIEIDISNLPSGVYFLRLTNDKTLDVGMIIKQ